ncbi:hypothetical protein O59_001736 [Cellvibrio sp. BR]|nr:hypothetical protein O59_001736 [Cellvibrio sp. BR]
MESPTKTAYHDNNIFYFYNNKLENGLNRQFSAFSVRDEFGRLFNLCCLFVTFILTSLG